MDVVFDADRVAVLEVGAPRQLRTVDELVVDVDRVVDFFVRVVFVLFFVVDDRLLEPEVLFDEFSVQQVVDDVADALAAAVDELGNVFFTCR